jgi:hypothetical protein
VLGREPDEFASTNEHLGFGDDIGGKGSWLESEAAGLLEIQSRGKKHDREGRSRPRR